MRGKVAFLAQQDSKEFGAMQDCQRMRAHDIFQHGAGIAAGGSRGYALCLACRMQRDFLDQRRENLVLVLEVMIERGAAQADGCGDVLHARVGKSAFAKKLRSAATIGSRTPIRTCVRPCFDTAISVRRAEGWVRW